MTVEEQGRIDRLLDSEADINIFAPLITQGYTKEDCFEVFSESGIKRPIMYDLGFSNNNCRGCLKAGGAGYWNLTRKHFPDVFNIRSKQEEMLGVALVKLSGNVILNNHIESFLKITKDIISGSLKELKVDGASKPLLKKGKPTDCTLLPKHLLGCVSEYTHYDGVVKGITYEGVLVNIYTLINKHPQVFKEMAEYLINTNQKGKMWGSSVRMPLRYLPENAGDKKSVEVGDCGFFCERKENDN